MKSEISLIRCNTYEPNKLFDKVKEAIELIGGIEKFIQPHSRVLLKPNLLMASPPESAITTHPEFARAVIKILKSIGCKIYLGDGSSVFGSENISEIHETTGMKNLAQEENIELVTFDKRFIPAPAALGFSRLSAKPRAERRADKQGYFPLTNWIKECDHIISLPKFKTHEFMILSGAVKNLFGLIPGTFKLECHKNFHRPENFARVLIDIYQAVKPSLTIVDGISGIQGNGPATSGTRRDFALILAGQDAIAVDSVLARIMNIKPDFIYTIKEARKRGIGNTDLNNIEIKGEDISSCVFNDFKLPETSLKQSILQNLPDPIANILKKLLTFYPRIDSDACRLCEACVKNCPQETIAKKDGKIIIDYSECISCFCCREVCPHKSIGIKKSLLARMIGK